MNKITISLIALTAMISSIGSAHSAPKKAKTVSNNIVARNAVLTNLNDSMNYALGLLNGAQLKTYQLKSDTTVETITEFINALQNGYDGNIEQLSEIASIGKNIGHAVKRAETVGLAEIPLWAINQKIFFQGLINGLYKDSTFMTTDAARKYFEDQYRASDTLDYNMVIGKVVKSKCGKKAKTIALKNQCDSINYAFGYINGIELAEYVLTADSTGQERQEFIKYVNIGLADDTKNPEIVNIGEQIGKSIKEQEAQGLVGEPSLTTNFELIKQGFIHGLLGYEEQLSSETAGEYIQNTINYLQYGQTKQENEDFLVMNASREGIITTPSGLQYEILVLGTGEKPTASDIVKVHYHGTLIDGNVFDSSINRGEPITFGLNQVIAGWTEGVQLMPVGSKFRFYIPQELGYGSQSVGSIPPYSTLIFEVELLGIE